MEFVSLHAQELPPLDITHPQTSLSSHKLKGDPPDFMPQSLSDSPISFVCPTPGPSLHRAFPPAPLPLTDTPYLGGDAPCKLMLRVSGHQHTTPSACPTPSWGSPLKGSPTPLLAQATFQHSPAYLVSPQFPYSAPLPPNKSWGSLLSEPLTPPAGLTLGAPQLSITTVQIGALP